MSLVVTTWASVQMLQYDHRPRHRPWWQPWPWSSTQTLASSRVMDLHMALSSNGLDITIASEGSTGHVDQHGPHGQHDPQMSKWLHAAAQTTHNGGNLGIKTDPSCSRIMDPGMALEGSLGSDITMLPGGSSGHSDQFPSSPAACLTPGHLITSDSSTEWKSKRLSMAIWAMDITQNPTVAGLWTQTWPVDTLDQSITMASGGNTSQYGHQWWNSLKTSTWFLMAVQVPPISLIFTAITSSVLPLSQLTSPLCFLPLPSLHNYSVFPSLHSIFVHHSGTATPALEGQGGSWLETFCLIKSFEVGRPTSNPDL